MKSHLIFCYSLYLYSVGEVNYSADIRLRLNRPGFKAISDASELEKSNEFK